VAFQIRDPAPPGHNHRTADTAGGPVWAGRSRHPGWYEVRPDRREEALASLLNRATVGRKYFCPCVYHSYHFPPVYHQKLRRNETVCDDLQRFAKTLKLAEVTRNPRVSGFFGAMMGTDF
jgi:hypothetical protein